MFAKSTAIFALVSLATRAAVAAPPACLIAAVNTQPDPSALQAVCSGKNATEVEEYICKHCGSNSDVAMKGFADVCSRAGVEIEETSSCSDNSTSSSASSSGTSSATSTRSSFYGTGTGAGSMITGTGSSNSMATHTFHTTYYDSACSCTKTGTVAATAVMGPSGISTATGTVGNHNGTMIAPTGGVQPSAGSGASSGSGSNSGSGSGSGTSASASASPSSGAGRVGMESVGMIALGAFGAMLAL